MTAGPVVGKLGITVQRGAGSIAGPLGIAVQLTPSAPGAARFAGALEVGLRRNPNRAQLLVSRVLGKHIPAPIGDVLSAAHTLGAAVRSACAAPFRLAAGDTEHDRLMLADADLAWVPAGSDLAACPDGKFVVTPHPGHAAAAQITQAWLDACADRYDSLAQVRQRPDPGAQGARQSTL